MVELVVTYLTEAARSPLAHLESAMAEGAVVGERGVTLREVAFRTMISLRVDPNGSAASRLAEVLGTTIPVSCGTVATGSTHQVLWLGPDEFLVISGDDAGDLTYRLVEALGDSSGLVVDVSANRTTLELSGPSARAVLEKGCMLDLHPRSFRAGTAVSTQIGPISAILYQVNDAPSYRILPRASFSEYVARWLLDAMLEYTTPELP